MPNEKPKAKRAANRPTHAVAKRGAPQGRKLSAKAAARRKPASFAEYLDTLAPEKREALEHLRAAIRRIAPTAEECISYDLPAFRLDGRIIAWIGAAASHIAMYGVTGLTAEEVARYDTSGKGTLRFPIADRPPLALIRRIVQARMARNGEKR